MAACKLCYAKHAQFCANIFQQVYLLMQQTMKSDAPSADLCATLAELIGGQYVLTDDSDLRYFSTDVYSSGQLPTAVVQPADAQDISEIVKLCAARRIPIVPRGGGASYTDGYLQVKAGGITVDTSRLQSIEIDERNSVVVVGAGCTWATLYETLKAKGWRTPFWGPFSGLAATIGGSISQHSVSHGTSAYGVSAESVIGIEVVTGTGEIIRTGSWGNKERSDGQLNSPFARHYGPDLAGLFTGDCGALGIKSRIALKMIRRSEAFEAISFTFDNFETMHEAMREIAIHRLDDENFAIDQALQQGQIGRQEGMGNKLGIAMAVLKSSPSLSTGLKQLLKMAASGDKAIRAAPYATHYLVDGVDRREARAKLFHIRQIGSKYGREIPNSVPLVVRSMPFAPLFNTLGPSGERWVPIHGLFAHDRVGQFHAALSQQRAENKAELERHGIWQGYMFCAVGSHAFLYEPATYWPGKTTIYHERQIPADYLSSLKKHAASDEADAVVARVKSETIALMQEYGSSHFQIGKVYPYMDGRNSASISLLKAIKAELDPHGILNPSALGL